MLKTEAVMDQKDKAMSGWIGDPPPDRERTPPSHANKWYKMMGAAHLLPDSDDKVNDTCHRDN